MAGYWPSSFFACLWNETKSRSKKSQIKNEAMQYLAILNKQAWSIKDLLYAFRENVSCGIQRVVPNGQDSSILTTRVANHSARFGLSCPLTELAIQPIRMQVGPCVFDFDDITPNFLVRRRAYVAWIVLVTLFCMAWYKIVIQRSLVVYHGISHESMDISWYITGKLCFYIW